jgi:hypothetical protein
MLVVVVMVCFRSVKDWRRRRPNSSALQCSQHIPYPTHPPTPSLPTLLLPRLLRKRNRTIPSIPLPPLLIHIRSHQLFHLCLHILRSDVRCRIRIIQYLVKQSQLSMAKIISAGQRAPRVVGIPSSSRHTARRRRKRTRNRRRRRTV